MKKILLLTAYLLLVALAGFSNPLDSLKQQLQLTTDDTQKASIYLQMAACYLEPQNATNPYTKRINQENAINYTMLAMKVYYRKDDTTGLVSSYSNLSKAYRAQKKYAQAKWFILQANTLSRRQHSTQSIIGTLVDLAAIKMDIKDYKLAKKDLKEAHRLAMANKLTAQDSLVKESYTRLYTYIQVPPNENVYQGLDESIKKEEQAYAARQKKLMAAMKPAKKALAKKKMLAVNVSRGESIRLAKPAINWETPMNSTPVDSLKTTAL
jgi:tetratricopeptide (TPR) repeat protein